MNCCYAVEGRLAEAVEGRRGGSRVECEDGNGGGLLKRCKGIEEWTEVQEQR